MRSADSRDLVRRARRVGAGWSTRSRILCLVLTVVLVLGTYSFAWAWPRPVRRFRLSSGIHFWSADPVECADVVDRLRGTYTYEGVAWTFNDAAGGWPLYRALDTRNGAHFYTADRNEYDHLPSYFEKEDVAYYVLLGKKLPGYSTVYRFNCPSRSYHFYTASETERDAVIASLGWLYAYEGAAWYFVADTPRVNDSGGNRPHTSAAYPQHAVPISLFLVPLPYWRTMAGYAAGEWNQIGASQLQFNFWDGSASRLLIYSDPRLGYAGITRRGYSGAWMTESDIIINTCYPNIDYQSVMAHEFGHAAGLSGTSYDADEGGDWLDDPMAWWLTMYSETLPGETQRRTLATEDIDGLRARYPAH